MRCAASASRPGTCRGTCTRGGRAGIGEVVTGESHAWVEWWVGEWVPFDPTNRSPVAESHVVLARGREYRDVAPLRGIYAGSATDGLDVKVRISRES